MAVPKRRTSKSRKNKRRTHHGVATVAIQACPRCGDPRRPHHVCPSCGFYADRKHVEVEEG